MPAALHSITLRVTARQRAQIQRLAEQTGVDEQEAILRAVEQVEEGPPMPSAYDLMKKHIGSFDGSPDLSTNKAHMEGFGAWRAHGEET